MLKKSMDQLSQEIYAYETEHEEIKKDLYYY